MLKIRVIGGAAIVLALSGGVALAKKEAFFVEQVALLSTYQGVCAVKVSDEAMQTAIGSAMIKEAINKATVIERARKRAYFIVADIQKNRTQNGFCQAITHYLENGYPR